MDLLFGYCAAVAWAFVVVFVVHRDRRRRWFRSATGINLVALTTALAIAFTLFVLPAVPRWAWLAVGTLIALSLTHRLAILLYDGRRRS